VEGSFLVDVYSPCVPEGLVEGLHKSETLLRTPCPTIWMCGGTPEASHPHEHCIAGFGSMPPGCMFSPRPSLELYRSILVRYKAWWHVFGIHILGLAIGRKESRFAYRDSLI